MNLPFDTQRYFVRVTGHRANGFVEFEFAIGEPELFVELILAPPAFEEFCKNNKAEILPARVKDDASDDWDWRLTDATHTRFK